MININKENVAAYLKEHIPDFDCSKPLEISMIGEGSVEEDGDGYLNFIFRVSDGNYHLIVKQGRSVGRDERFQNLSTDRTRLEYDSMKITHAIVPEYVPKLYFYDDENHVFVSEDVSYLQIIRFQLNKSVIFPNFAKHASTYLAKTHFYLSEYYMDTEKFRELAVHFTNHKMRNIFDNIMFLSQDENGNLPDAMPLEPEYEPYIKDIVFDPDAVLERYKLREIFMKKAEALIHADYHTSNIFAGEDEIKVIDMEYSFCGPVAFDVGYLLGHLSSQYICACFRAYEDEAKREEFKAYMLETLNEIFTNYVRLFIEYWNKDAKPEYRNVKGLQENFLDNLLEQTIGFCASTNLYRVASNIGFPEYDEIEDPLNRRHAVVLSALMDRRMLLQKANYRSIEDWTKDLVNMAQAYQCYIEKLNNEK